MRSAVTKHISKGKDDPGITYMVIRDTKVDTLLCSRRKQILTDSNSTMYDGQEVKTKVVEERIYEYKRSGEYRYFYQYAKEEGQDAFLMEINLNSILTALVDKANKYEVTDAGEKFLDDCPKL